MTKKSNRGRKSKWESHVKPYLDRIPKWRRQGMTEQQIWDKLNVGTSTAERYKLEYRELREALKNGKEELIENLETSLYKKAMGYEYEETKTVREKDDNGKDKVRIEVTKKHLAPDTGALAFALKNLDPERWRDRHDIEYRGEIDHKIDKELEERLKADEQAQKLLKELYQHTKGLGDISQE